MKQLICTILLLGCMPLIALTQEHGTTTSDSSNLTNITTTDFMETLEKGKLNWNTVSRFQARCRWGYCNPPRDYGYGSDWGIRICCTFWQMIGNFLFGSGGSNPTEITANGEDGGGAGGSGGWIGTIFGGATSYTPIQPSIGVGGGGTNNNNTGNTGTPPPIKPAILTGGGTVREDSTAMPKDTVQPVKVPCDSAAIARGAYADSLWNELDSTGTEKKRLQDSAKNGKFESAFQIKKDNTGKFKAFNFTTSTSATNVAPPTTGDTLYGGAHCHNYTNGINSQSPNDFYRLLESFKQKTTFRIDFLTSYDDTEWAIMIDDSLAANLFLLSVPSADGLDSTGDWSSTTINPITGRTYYDDFFDYGKKMYFQNYPSALQSAYANIYMINKMFNTGIKVLKKVGNNFKEMNVHEDEDSSGKKILKIKICE